MTEFTKARWETEGDTIRTNVEFSKVNQEKRLVSGWATLDNVDTQGDIVLAEASARAFSRARGNLREMHKKDSAVGKIVSFKEKTFRTPDGEKHQGIFVTAYVSKGAPSTWEKVLDGTLSGFSIGGSIVDSEEDFNKDANSTVRVIKDYELTELSLVDNPGNQFANVFHIQKSVDGSVTKVTGIATQVDVVNVFYCSTDAITLEEEDDTAECPVCNKNMANIGWVESGPERNEKVNELVTKYLEPTASADDISKGGDEVANKENENDESVETGHEEGDPTEVPTPAEPAQGTDEVNEVTDASDETVEKAEVVEEVEDEEQVITKKIDDLHNAINDSLNKTRDETKETVQALEKKIDDLNESFTKKASEFEKKFEELDGNLETAKSRLSDFEKSLTKINSQAAFRKSVDFEESTVRESDNNDPWEGSAFSVHSIIGR